MSTTLNLFVSCAHADPEAICDLALNLHRRNLAVCYAGWEIGAGDVRIRGPRAGILNPRDGILVFPSSLTAPEDPAVAVPTWAVAGTTRLITLPRKDAGLPPVTGSRVQAGIRTADAMICLQRLRALLPASRGRGLRAPAYTGKFKPPFDSGLRAGRQIPLHLRIGDGEAVLTGGESGEVREAIAGADADLKELKRKQERVLRSMGAVAQHGTERDRIEHVLHELGERLRAAFLPAKVAKALDSELARAIRDNANLELALEVADPAVVDLPWETLRLPSGAGTALALHPRIDLYRYIPRGGPGSAVSIPGPLRILVAIGSPEAQNSRGELLDMEAELKVILDAVEPARRTAERPIVRILERGSVGAIRQALEHQRYHVLYISSHAEPGVLILEDADGREDRVTAERFWRDALPAGRGVPLLVLAGCATGRDEGSVGTADEERLPSLARELVAHGVPSVIAMQASVTDRYATALAGALFRALATWRLPEPLHALAEARRSLEQKRLEHASAWQVPPEWPTPAMYATASPPPMYDPTAPVQDLPFSVEPVLDRGVVVRRVGDLVGRRREERLMLKALRAESRAGIVLYGLGGVGKSTLAAQVLHRLTNDGWLVVSLSGPVDCDRVMDELGRRLLEVCPVESRDEHDPLRRIANDAREPKLAWQERLDLLVRNAFATIPLVFLFNNFEDNLDVERGRVEGDLADLLARWVEQRGKSRLLFTCRYPFKLPGGAENRLELLHLGPLSPSETRKLVLRLEGLGKLQPEELVRAYEEVGGHPRALEYLDALLRGGRARFPDLEHRLKAALQTRNIPAPSERRAATGGALDRALAETTALAADDQLLDELLRQLDPTPLAQRLLIGASVYRVPVVRSALAWQVTETAERADDPARRAHPERAQQLHADTPASGQGAGPAALGLSEAETHRFIHNPEEAERLSVEEPEHFPEAIALLQSLSLLSPVQYTDDDVPRYIVHRWTARALSSRIPADQLADAHRRAAGYWHSRVKVQPQTRKQDIEELLEARHHYREAGELPQAIAVTEHVCLQLNAWGAWQREERLCREALGWVPEDSPDAANFLHQLGIIAQTRGDHERALQLYRRALTIVTALGDRVRMAGSYHQLGNIGYLRGDYRAAMEWYDKASEIFRALGDRGGMASTYHQLGIVAQARGDGDGALEWYRKALEIEGELGDRAGMASTISQIGALYTERGEAEAAVPFNGRSLMVRLEIGSPEAGIDLHWLTRQRDALGPEPFRRILLRYSSEAGAAQVLALMDEYAASDSRM